MTSHRSSALALAAAFALAAAPALAQGLEDQLVIVTSFSKDLTAPYAQAFEKKYPGTKVEVQNRNTAAAVTFIRETRSSPPDIMWASAPDAFEVLKKDKLLQKYQPKAQGIADKVGSYPVNDPRRLLRRLRRVRLRHHVQHALSAREQPARAEGMGRPQEADLLRPCRHFGAVALRHHASDGRDHPAGRRLGQRLGDAARDRRQSGAGVRPLVRRARRGQQRPVRHRHRDRLLRAVRQGVGLPGRVRLSDA